ncbi:TetR family transcriptional regulator [Streptomyces griseoviridis]|uniref:TetR family transcriptional regulator n=2 Tax=Streptomyces TaxID=1883 RepID=A0A3Q9KPW5_STRGD|nr:MULTISPECIES: TetR/AcrR family transcriptional regulator C-terminal domain-containing protein [Streptomyces]AZS86564.1 TetR family transcriptional regulator [Streptomyces griseoviridis]MDH6699992.1 TetR/AcrR family tetracycline transcriptional repressor [Streptomyces sp. MAA16]MDT0470925.1 TetR/AcrR family transcriptional regulator C-terminal domain-containing protein [Streptomyces sp. DSM 41014]QCN86573.1 TetR family transcriptional regulator [Streptomyces griseoviridis]
MTNKQVPSAAAPAPRTRLTPATVVAAALRLLDDEGLDTVTTRAVADRLGVRMNTVLWHVKTKRRLLELMADGIAGTITYDGLPEDPAERALELIRRYRRSLLAHRDGAALVTGTYAAEPHTLRFADTVIGALTEHTGSVETSARTCFALIYFTLGLTQEEQAMADADPGRLDEAVTSGHYPALLAARAALAQGTFPDRFEDGIRRILG